MKKIHATFFVDEEILLQESGQSSLAEAFSQEMGWLHDSGIRLESWTFEKDHDRSHCQQMVQDEIVLNGAGYGLSASEVAGMRNDSIVVNNITDAMEGFINRDGDHEYAAMEKAFQSTMQCETQAYRAYTLQKQIPGLNIIHDRYGDFDIVGLEGMGEFFVSPTHGLCLDRKDPLDDSYCDQVVSTISAIGPGDAFFVSHTDNSVTLCVSLDGSHQTFDEPDNPWIVYDLEGNSWFESDINAEVPDMLTRFIKTIYEKQHQKDTCALSEKIENATQRAGQGSLTVEKPLEY